MTKEQNRRNSILFIEDDPVRLTTVEEMQLALCGEILFVEYSPEFEPSEPSDE